MVMTNPETDEVTEGQVETIIKAGLGRLTWPAALVQPAVGWSLQRMGDGIELRDAHGGPWVRCAVRLEPRWISAAVSCGQVLVVYRVRSRFRPTRETAATALPSGGRNYSRRDGRASWLLGSYAGSDPSGCHAQVTRSQPAGRPRRRVRLAGRPES